MRSEKNYAHKLAERLGARLVDLTVSGATTTTSSTRPSKWPKEPCFRRKSMVSPPMRTS